MTDLRNRRFELNLGGVRIASETIGGDPKRLLRVVFKVERDLDKTPNSVEVSIYNLRQETRSAVSQKKILTTLAAGYVGIFSQIFGGNLEFGSTSREGADWITKFESTDGAQQLRNSRINLSFKPGVEIKEALQRAAESLGVALGNVADKAAAGNLRGALQEFGNGLVLSGPGVREFDKLVRLTGRQWSIQDGEIQILDPGEVIDPGQAIVLGPTTGLIGSPQPGEDGVVNARSLLIPSLIPGRLVNLQSQLIQGFHRIERTVFSGDTRGEPWYADIEVSPQ